MVRNELEQKPEDTKFPGFCELEELYGSPLSTAEKTDIIQRFNEFVGILREGYSEILGADVYIKKD